MRVLAYIVTVIVATGLVLGGTLAIVFATPRPPGGGTEPAAYLAITAVSIFVYGPVLLGSLTAYWNVQSSADAKRYFRRSTLVVLGLDALAAVAIILYAVLTGAPLWIPIVFIAVAALLLVVALRVGPALLRQDEAHPRPSDQWRPIEHREIMRKIATMAITFAVVLVVGLIVFSALLPARADLSAAGRALLSSLLFALIAAAMAGIIVSQPLTRQVRTVTDRDFGLTRRIGLVVLRGKSIELDARETVIAAKYASVMSVVLGFQLSYFVLLYLGIGLNLLQSNSSSRSGVFTAVPRVVIIVALVALVPVLALRIRRVRRYAREHAQLLTIDDPDGNPAASTPPPAAPAQNPAASTPPPAPEWNA